MSERLPRLPKEFKADDLPRYWSYLMQTQEDIGLRGTFAAAVLAGCRVWSLQYDGLMIAPPSPHRLLETMRSEREYERCLLSVAELVVEYLLGYPMPLKCKDLPLPTIFAENLQLKAAFRTVCIEKDTLRTVCIEKDAEIARLKAENASLKAGKKA